MRLRELGINPPDPTLLMGTLDKLMGVTVKSAPQAGFRLSTARAALQVDTLPTLQGAMQFSEVLMAETEAVCHGGASLPVNTTKVRAVNAEQQAALPPGGQQPQGDRRPNAPLPSKGPTGGEGGGTEKVPCKFFAMASGCKKGKSCAFAHEWGPAGKAGRCWTCGSTQHMKPDCPVKDSTALKKESTPSTPSKPKQSATSTPSTKKATGGEKPTGEPRMGDTEPQKEKEEMDKKGDDFQDLVKEAASLLKSLRAPSMKATRLCSLEGCSSGRALLDGGATHVLRQARSDEEFASAAPIRVELAAGEITLRQLPNGTLLTDFPAQTIIPLWRLAMMGYQVVWGKDGFILRDKMGQNVEVELETNCPILSPRRLGNG